MPKNEDGEFELILGNRQLLSVFFFVIILLGVFFAMGYILARNSPPANPEVAGNRTPEVKIPVADAPGKSPEAPATPPTPPETAPEQTAPAPPEPEVEPERPQPERRKPASAKVESTRAAVSNRPVPGETYLQLAATSQHEADILVDVLRKKSFKAVAAEIEERPGTFRVLVGPITDTTANKMRADLQGAGFPGNAAIRRTFQ